MGGAPGEAASLVRVWQSSLKEARRRAMLDRQRVEARFRSAPFPLYGLPPSWKGARFLGGGEWGGMPGRERTKALSLVHGTLVEGEGPILAVETASEFSIGGGALLSAAGMVWAGRSPNIEEAFRELTRDDADSDLPDVFPVRSELVVSVDAVPTSFDAFVDDDEWVARAEIGPLFLIVTGKSFDPDEVSLVQITDIEPYVLGTRQFYKRG
jgi:hypothetical protein